MHTICYWLVACLSGNPLVLVDMSGPGNTWMGDHLRVGKTILVCNEPPRSTQSSIPLGYFNQFTSISDWH